MIPLGQTVIYVFSVRFTHYALTELRIMRKFLLLISAGFHRPATETGNLPMNMLQTIQAGAAQAVKDDPRPLAATKSATMTLIDKLDDELAARGPLGSTVGKEEPLPGVTHYGRIYDQPAFTKAFLARQKARQIDTDLDTECRVDDPRHSLAGHPDLILCPDCRERMASELERAP